MHIQFYWLHKKERTQNISIEESCMRTWYHKRHTRAAFSARLFFILLFIDFDSDQRMLSKQASFLCLFLSSIPTSSQAIVDVSLMNHILVRCMALTSYVCEYKWKYTFVMTNEIRIWHKRKIINFLFNRNFYFILFCIPFLLSLFLFYSHPSEFHQ